MKRLGLCVLAVATVGGCAAPGTPGMGAGADYTPIIDTQGVPMDRYAQDLSACRQLARGIDTQTAMAQGAAAGILAGAITSAIFRSNYRQTDQNMSVGAVAGMSQQANQATGQQKNILINCMVGRGYRALEVTPPLGQIAPPAAQPMPAPRPQAEAPMPRTVAQAPIGENAYQIERMPEAKACNASRRASIINKGPGFEVYTVMCNDGDSLTVRCEFGNCRALK